MRAAPVRYAAAGMRTVRASRALEAAELDRRILARSTGFCGSARASCCSNLTVAPGNLAAYLSVHALYSRPISVCKVAARVISPSLCI